MVSWSDLVTWFWGYYFGVLQLFLQSNLAFECARDFLVSNRMFLGMVNHLVPFSGASDWSEGQDLGGWAVGDQGCLQGVKNDNYGSEQARNLTLVLNPMF